MDKLSPAKVKLRLRRALCITALLLVLVSLLVGFYIVMVHHEPEIILWLYFVAALLGAISIVLWLYLWNLSKHL